jgi:GTP-binding protein Era
LKRKDSYFGDGNQALFCRTGNNGAGNSKSRKKQYICRKKMHRSGFVNIIGNPNTGKSTLMNALVGERLSIITSKAQTTRHRIMGVVSGADFQIVYSDTPGILKPNYRLQESMMRFVGGAMRDADVILYVTDVVEQSGRSREFVEKINLSGIPTIVVINKIDLTNEERLGELVSLWRERMPSAEVAPTSATERFNIGGLFDLILARLPEGEAYYPKDTLTDKNMRFFASEIIREKILLNYDKEIPYSVEIAVEEYSEEPTIDRITATIYVARESQKGIVIGHKGAMLKRVGTAARIELEQFLGKKVFLQLHVKVNDNWRDNIRQLKRFGYEE